MVSCHALAQPYTFDQVSHGGGKIGDRDALAQRLVEMFQSLLQHLLELFYPQYMLSYCRAADLLTPQAVRYGTEPEYP